MAGTPGSRLSSRIVDEVKDFHPLLNNLLARLPQVLKVEYTHGPSEMGADFVVTRKDVTFDTSEYVGVIAKVGKVVQDLLDIERQIDECAVARLVGGGKDKVRLNEVWVVLTEHITKGAQEKIHEKFKTRKIRFIQGNDLEQLIDKHLPVYWTNLEIDLGVYLTTLREKTQTLDRSLSLLPADSKSLYIEQDIYRSKPIEYKFKNHTSGRPEKIDIYAEIPKKKVLLIEGEMGLGKSKLIRRLIEHYSDPEVYNQTHLIPIYVTYRDLLSSFNGKVRLLIESRVGKTIMGSLKQPKYLLLIDGLDEVNMSSDEQMSSISSICTQIHDDSEVKAVMCSRYMKALDQPGVFHPDDQRYDLRPLSMSKTIEFLKALCDRLNLASRVVEDLKKSQLFKELPHSPIAAILLAKLLNDNSQELPSNMTELYSKYLELMLGRWDIEKGLQSQKEYQALDNIMMDLAKHFIDNEIHQLSIAEAKDMFREYLEARHLDISAEDLFQKLLGRCEVMIADTDTGTIFFKHRTFAEYFYARMLQRDGSVEIDERAFQFYWVNVFFFYLGILKDSPKQLTKIMALIPGSEGERFLKLINAPNFLLAAYTTPYQVIVKSMERLMVEASQLYQSIVSGESGSPITKLPRMAVLSLFRFLLRQYYSYEFFKSALEECALLIDDGTYDENTKSYSLFFLNLIYVDLNSKDSFDFLLKRRVGKLPLDITIALRIEEKNLEQRGDLIRKQDKHFQRLMKDNRALKSQIDEIFDRPIQFVKSTRKTASLPKSGK